MGAQHVTTGKATQDAQQEFSRALLDDLGALEQMIASGMIESGVQRIGAEQEMFLVDARGRPAPLALRVLEVLDDPDCTTELGLFNLECNIPPLRLGGSCLRELETMLLAAVGRVRTAVREMGGDVVLTGILPSLELSDLALRNMTPLPRYQEINRLIMDLCGGKARALINGIDQLQVVHDNVMLEACNTSFQVHLQVSVKDFPRVYNLAQVVTAPVLAASVNAPLLMQHRLWRETRIALFEQSLDIRTEAGRLRGSWQRVSFGHDWVHQTPLEIFRDQIARHRILLTQETGERSSAMLARGEVPPLRALRMHNGTVYRWNRLCYGVSEGVPHLRIEHRPLPAGPTVVDEVANAALFYGLIKGLDTQYGDVREHFQFEDVRGNFLAAARSGLGATLRWGDAYVRANDLLLGQLIPMAHEGLDQLGIPEQDRRRYLNVIEERVRGGRTGAQWQLDAFRAASSAKTRSVQGLEVTRMMMARAESGEPVHTWGVPEGTGVDWRDHCRSVAQLMTTDVFTTRPEDLLDVAVALMDWKHIRHVPVENDEGRLVGLLSYRSLLRHASGRGQPQPITVSEVMEADPVTVAPDATCADAIRLMRAHGVACLPVVHQDRLVGIVSERDFLGVAIRLMEELEP